jgi:hypothetical protein
MVGPRKSSAEDFVANEIKKPRKTRSDKGKKRKPNRPHPPTVIKPKTGQVRKKRAAGEKITLPDMREYADHQMHRLEELAYATRGNVTKVAEEIGTSRLTLTRLMKERPRVQEAFDNARLSLVDTAENTIFEVMNDPDHPQRVTAAIWTTKTLGKDRGWIERPQDDRSYAPQISITINAPWQKEAEKAEEIVDAVEVKEIEGESADEGE